MTHSSTPRQVRLSRTGRVPDEARVRHFDELDDGAQEFVAHYAAGRRDVAAVADLDDGDVVVFTDYFSVRCA